MGDLKTKFYFSLITSVLLCGKAYSQTTNMSLPNQVGVYNPNIKTQQMGLPSQVGVYAPQNQRNRAFYNPNRPYVVTDYNKSPIINNNLYNQTNGFTSPIKYTFQKNNNTPTSNDEFDTEYYMILGYGKGSSKKDGLTNPSTEIPMNNVSEGLGDTSILTLGFGAMQDRKIGIDVTYTNISGLSYDSTSYTEYQFCGPNDYDNTGFYFDCNTENPVNGGSISSSSLMLNIHYPLTDIFGKWLDGFITPYISGGIGMSFNSISDYSVSYNYLGNPAGSENFEVDIPIDTSGLPYNDQGQGLFGFYNENGVIKHFGASTNNIAWSAEIGATFDIDKSTFLDLYYKINNYGTVKSKDTVYYSYDVIDIVNPISAGLCSTEAEGYDYEYNSATGWCESIDGTVTGFSSGYEEKGKIETQEIGAKLRLIF